MLGSHRWLLMLFYQHNTNYFAWYIYSQYIIPYPWKLFGCEARFFRLEFSLNVTHAIPLLSFVVSLTKYHLMIRAIAGLSQRETYTIHCWNSVYKNRICQFRSTGSVLVLFISESCNKRWHVQIKLDIVKTIVNLE